MHIWHMNGTVLASGGAVATIPLAWEIQGTGDFNGDGKRDLVWRNTSTGQVDMWLMNGTTLASGGTVATIPLAWEIQGTGDFNGVTNTTVLNSDGFYGTTDTYRYATINGVHLALPTFGGGVNATDNQFRIGTSVGDAGRENGSNAVNDTYNDMMAIWDAYNGTWQGSWDAWQNTGATVGQVMLNGTPPGWEVPYLGYWTATNANAAGHQFVNLNSGNYGEASGWYDGGSNYVALQVLPS